MDTSRPQISVATLLGLVACLALNFWLFRLGVLWGILGLNITKHVGIALLCQGLGVDRSTCPEPALPGAEEPPSSRIALPEAPASRVDRADAIG